MNLRLVLSVNFNRGSMLLCATKILILCLLATLQVVQGQIGNLNLDSVLQLEESLSNFSSLSRSQWTTLVDFCPHSRSQPNLSTGGQEKEQFFEFFIDSYTKARRARLWR